jgi:hypothetical protein
MEGGVTVILTLLILFGAIAGAIALFGAGGYVQRRRLEGKQDEDQPRPQHTVVDDDERRDVVVPARNTTRTQGPE